MSQGAALVRLSTVGRSFRTARSEVRVLADLSMSVAPGEAVAVMGANGIGKSTLAGILAGVDDGFDGQVERASGVPPQSPMIFQDFRASLLPWLSVEANIGFPLALQGMSRADRRARVQDIVAQAPVRLQMDTPVKKLSGGQAQLVCILRGLIVSPQMLVCDEPFSAIDYPARLMLRKLISERCRMAKISLVMISHSIEDSLYIADRILVLSGNPATIVNEVVVETSECRDDNWVDGEYASALRRVLRDSLTATEASPLLPARNA